MSDDGVIMTNFVRASGAAAGGVVQRRVPGARLVGRLSLALPRSRRPSRLLAPSSLHCRYVRMRMGAMRR